MSKILFTIMYLGAYLISSLFYLLGRSAADIKYMRIGIRGFYKQGIDDRTEQIRQFNK